MQLKRIQESVARRLTLAGFLLLSVGPIAPQSQTISPEQRAEFESIIREYLVKNTDVLREALAALDKEQAAVETERQRAAVKDNGEALFNSARDVVIGNPNGNVNLVEFFDYNCGFCKRALEDKLELIKSDSDLRVILKELPVLGPGSVEAARVAAAVRMQDSTGQKYFQFHQQMLTGRGQADQARALAVATEVGLDYAQLERDMASEEVRLSIEESSKLAEKLGIRGTPSYVIGGELVIGAVGLAVLRDKVNTARCGKPAC